MKRLIAVLCCVLSSGCFLTQPPVDESAVTAILNGPTLAEATTYWRKPDCFIEYGNGFCSGPFFFVLAADGTMRWSVSANGLNVGNQDRWGVTTWTRLGDRSLSFDDLPFQTAPSRSLSGINGSLSDGIFHASYEKNTQAPFTAQTGKMPAYCSCENAFAHGIAQCDESRDGFCALAACEPGWGNCDGKVSNGCERDLASEVKNVDQASCQPDGGTIDYGSCLAGFLDCDGNRANGCEYPASPCPERLSSVGGNGLAIDATHVFWTASDGTVRRLTLAGTQAQTLTTGESNFGGLAGDATHLYWVNTVNFGGLSRMLKNGTNLERLHTGGPGRSLALDSTHVYWSDGNSLNRRELSTPQVETVASALGILYVALAGGEAVTTSTSGAVWRIPLDGGTVDRLDSTQTGGGAIAATATTVYWVAPEGLFAAPYDGGLPVKLGAADGQSALALDGAQLFWSADGGIYARALSGGADVKVAGQPASAITASSTHVYWVNSQGLFRVPR